MQLVQSLKKYNIFLFFGLCFMLIHAKSVNAQQVTKLSDVDTSKNYLVKMLDGTELTGKILHLDSNKLILSTLSISKLELENKKIKSVTAIDNAQFKGGVYWFENPNSTRYLFGPSAFNLKKGEGYYQNTYLVLNSFNYGISDYLSIGGGIELISTFSTWANNGVPQPIFYVTPKIAVEVVKNFRVGAGVYYLSIPSFGAFEDKRAHAGIFYGVGTYGNADDNITLGLGYGFVDNESTQSPIITVSGMKRISRKTALVTENWFAPIQEFGGGNSYYGIYSYGIRFFGEKLSVDLAFINNPDIFESIIIGIPYIDFVVKF